MDYRDDVYFNASVEPERAFSKAELSARLARVRRAMAAAKIDCLFPTSPESLY